MKRSKRLITAFLAFLVVFSAVAVPMGAKASVPGDVKDTPYSEAVQKLAALKILQGYPDGTFRPANSITRAEFATAVVNLLGLGDDAAFVKKVTKFNDVPADHWATGYINIATEQGVISGYPDGTFRPEQPVTYNEAITMLVRMLGYGISVVGGYPAGYVAKAREIGITDGVKASSQVATRGDVAIMLANSLTIDLMEQNSWGDDNVYQEIPGKTLLNKIYDITEVEGIVTETPAVSEGVLDNNEIKFVATEDVINDYDPNTYEDGKTYDATVLPDINIDELLGEEVTLWVNDDDEVVNVEIDTDPDDIINDWIANVDPDKNEIELDNEDTYDLAQDVVAYYNGARINIDDKAAESAGGDYLLNTGYPMVKLVLNDDGEVIFIDAWGVYNDKITLVIDEVDVENEELEGFDQNGSTIKLELDDVDYVVKKDGKTISLADIQEDDVVYVFVPGDDPTDIDASNIDFYNLWVYDKKVEGTLEKVKAEGSSTWDYAIIVDGEEYWLDGYTTYVLDEDDDPEFIDEDGEIDDNLDDLVGEEVTLLFDYEGCVRHIEAKDAVASADDEDEIVAVVTEKPWRSTGSSRDVFFEVLNPSDDEVVYQITDDTEFEGLTGAAGNLGNALDEGNLNEDGSFDPHETYVFDVDLYDATELKDTLPTVLAEGTPVRITLDKDGAAELIEILAAKDDTEEWFVPIDDSDITLNKITDYDTDDNTIKVGSTWAVKAGSTTVYDKADLEVKTWDELEGILGKLTDDVLLVRDGSKVDYLVVLSDSSLGYKTDSDVAMVIDRYLDSGEWYLLIDEYGKQNAYEITDNSVLSWEDNNVGNAVYGTQDLRNLNVGDIIEYSISGGDLEDIIEHRGIEARVARGGVDVDDETLEIDEVVVKSGEKTDEQGNVTKEYWAEVKDTDDAIANKDIVGYQYDYNSNEFVHKTLTTDEFIINEDTVVYDNTGSTPKLVNFSDIKSGDKVTLIDFDGDDVLEAIVIIREYEFE